MKTLLNKTKSISNQTDIFSAIQESIETVLPTHSQVFSADFINKPPFQNYLIRENLNKTQFDSIDLWKNWMETAFIEKIVNDSSSYELKNQELKYEMNPLITLSALIHIYHNNILYEIVCGNLNMLTHKEYLNTLWESELSIKKLILEKHNFKVNKIRVLNLLMDWDKKRMLEPNYPKSPVMANMVIPFEEKETIELISDHYEEIKKAENGKLTECTDSEKAFNKNNKPLRCVYHCPINSECRYYTHRKKLN